MRSPCGSPIGPAPATRGRSSIASATGGAAVLTAGTSSLTRRTGDQTLASVPAGPPAGTGRSSEALVPPLSPPGRRAPPRGEERKIENRVGWVTTAGWLVTAPGAPPGAASATV